MAVEPGELRRIAEQARHRRIEIDQRDMTHARIAEHLARGEAITAASADLGAHSGRTFRSVVMPIIFPSIVAGSIFTFSLSLGDYITAQIVGGKVTMLGNVVEQNYVTNLPFAAAMATIPVLIMVIYLLAIRRTGALESL